MKAFRRNPHLLLAGILALAGCSASATQTSRTLMDAADRFFTRNGVTIRYRVIGQGEPVLLVHGYTDRVEMWAGTADSLARDFQVIVPDWRGFGLSTKLGDPAQYGRHTVDDLTALLDHLSISSAHVMGYSGGAVMVAHLALDDPARIRTATLVAGAFYPDSTAAARAFGPYVDSLATGHGLGPFFRWILPTWSDSAIAAMLPELTAANDSASLVASIRALPGLMIGPKKLAEAKVPGLAVVSVRDRVHPQSRYVAQHWPGLKLVELETYDHSDIFLAHELITEFRKLARP
jgi:pimeloyl-ACP methyl ester carboxylesterase